MISLVDSHYYSRAWCAAEIMMIQTLRKSYKFHMWYQDVWEEMAQGHVLEEVAGEVEIDMARKDVTFESDRPTLLFLERQTRLLE
jgi:hypothetical protein